MSNKKEEILRECIKNCEACVLYCKKMEGMYNCINVCSDCIVCCNLCLTSNFTDKKLYNYLLIMCIEACKSCVNVCKMHDNIYCKRCVESSTKCVKMFSNDLNINTHSVQDKYFKYKEKYLNLKNALY